MAYTPLIPMSGLAGWRFLERTSERQQAAFEKSAEVGRQVAYFKEKIGSVTSAADLLGDRRLLTFALTAFGLEKDVDKKAFLRKVLEDDLLEPKALANRLSAPEYKQMAEAFGFNGGGKGSTATPGFADKIVAAYKTRAFEAAVGAVNDDMRLALNFRRTIADLSKGETGGSWYKVIGSNPLREVFETAYGLGSAFGKVDVDRQRDILRDKTSKMFGTENLTAFAKPENVEKLINRFLARAQMEGGGGSTMSSPALTLLQGAAAGASGLFNLILSR